MRCWSATSVPHSISHLRTSANAPQACASLNPSCTCTFCTVNFHCPHCARKPHVRAKCRLDAELKAKKDAELRAKAKLERDRMERGQADELAGAMNEFFTALYTDTDAPADASAPYMTSSFADLPLSSPDSITVTTEFGVLEETGNVTIISAGGGPHPYDEEDDLEYEEYNEELGEEHYEGQEYNHPGHVAHDDHANYVIHTEDTAAPNQGGLPTTGLPTTGVSTTGVSTGVLPGLGMPNPGPLPTVALPTTDWVAAVALQHQQEQNMWLLQQQMQNLYNVSLGNNTTPPPTQHVAPVVYHQEGELELEVEESEGDEGDEADVDTDEADVVLDE